MWFDRLERFQLKVKYRPGKDCVRADTLSRAPGVMVAEGEVIEDNTESLVLKEHIKLNHRMKITKELEKIGF
jgi:hypothetical protein